MLRDSSPPPLPPPPPPPSPTHLEIEPDEQWKTGLRKPHGDTERGFDDNSENRYRSGGREDERGELDKSVESAEDDDLEEGEEREDSVINPQHSHPPPPRVSLTQPSHSKSLLPQRNAPSRQRRPPNFHPTEDNDDEDLDKSKWQRHGSRPFLSSEPPHQSFSGPLPSGSIPRPVISAPEPSGISRTLVYAAGQISSQVPSQLARHGNVRSTNYGAGHHPSSASPHGKPDLSSLGEAVRFPVSVSPVSQSIHGLQHSPETTKQGIPIPSRLAHRGSVRSTGSTGRSAGHRYVASLNSDLNRGGPHEQQTSSSASPLDKPNLSSLSEAVRFPVSVSPGSQPIHGLQRFPEVTKQGIPIPRGPLPPGDIVDDHDQQSVYSVPRIRIMCSRQSMDSEQVDVPWDIKEVRQRLEQAEHAEEDVRQADSPNNMSEFGTLKDVEPNREMDARQRKAEVRTYGAIAETREAEAKRKEAEAEERKAEAQTSEAESQTREAEFLTRKAEAQTWEATAKRREAEAKTREAEAQARDVEAQTREAEAQTIEAEAKAKDAEVQHNWVESRHRYTTAWPMEEEARMENGPHFFEQACQSSKAEHLKMQLEVEAKMCSTAPQKEAVADSKVADTMEREADAQTKEATVQTMEADTLCKEEELRHRESEVFRLEEKAQQALAEAEQLEAGARQAEAFAKMLEAAAQQKEAEATSSEAEARKLEVDVQNREAKVRFREEEARKMQEKVRCLESAHQSSVEVDLLVACAH
jgi:hypothetical protein